MKKNIATTIRFSGEKIFFTVIETIAANQVEIFSGADDVKNAFPFLENVLKQVNSLVGGVISNVSIVVNDSKQTNGRIKPYLHKIDIAGDTVSKTDIENIISLTKLNFKSDDSEVTLVQPVKFRVFDRLWKTYDTAPISKKGSILEITSAVTLINKNVYDYVVNIVNRHGLMIDEILLSTQAISQNNLSESALTTGSVLIHVGKYQTFITINKHLSTIASLSIYDFGYNQLVNAIAKMFDISKHEAIDLITVHGTLFEDTNRVIISKNVGSVTKTYTSKTLNRIIYSFISKLLLVSKKFINQKNVTTLPVIISGNVEHLDGIVEISTSYLDATSVSVYNPLSFIETCLGNKEAIGAVLFNRRMDQINGRQLNTIVETNPELISSLRKKENSSILSKIIERIGGKNVWK